MNERFERLRLLEAILFATAEPLSGKQLARHVPEGADLEDLLEELAGLYANRGVNLVRSGDRWAFRTAPDLAGLMQVENKVVRRLSRAALETLSVVAYHQPVTRGEIEEIRGVSLSKGTLDTLLEIGWVKPKGRRRTPGRPVTWGTTEDFLDHFGLEALDSLPRAGELKAAGLLDSRPAIMALGERGFLTGDADMPVGPDQEEDPIEEEPWDILAAEFGEDPRSDSGDSEAPPDAAPERAAASPLREVEVLHPDETHG